MFANALGGTFVFDDLFDVLENKSARAETFFDRLPYMNRPLTKASYAAQDAVHGAWATGYHAVNVVLHVGTSILAFFLLRRAFAFAGQSRSAAPAAFAIALIWAVHPALTESVTYVSGRSMVLSAFATMAALLAASGSQSARNVVVAPIAALGAILARETALVLPAIAIWWALTLQPPEPLRVAIRRWVPLMLGCAAGAAVIFMLPRHEALIAESLRTRPPLDALLGNVHAAADILSYWFTPWRVTIDPEAPLAWPWSDPRTLAKLALFCVLAVGTVIARRRLPLFAFGTGLALLALVPSNSILWRADPVSLKPLYLGGFGLTLAIASLLATHKLASRAMRSAVVGLVVVLAASLAVQTSQRNALFADDIALWQDATAKTPDYGRPWIMLGYAYFNAERFVEARDALQRGCALAPWDEAASKTLEIVETILNERSL